MGSVIREISIAVSADSAWIAVSDVGNVHKKLVPGFVTDTALTDDVRTVTFANGVVIRERIVTIDPEARRIAYGSIGGQAAHHNASIQIVPDGDASC
jgi:hypothetical protein